MQNHLPIILAIAASIVSGLASYTVTPRNYPISASICILRCTAAERSGLQHGSADGYFRVSRKTIHNWFVAAEKSDSTPWTRTQSAAPISAVGQTTPEATATGARSNNGRFEQHTLKRLRDWQSASTNSSGTGLKQSWQTNNSSNSNNGHQTGRLAISRKRVLFDPVHAWQEAGETLSLPSQRSKLRLMNRVNELEALCLKAASPACIDAFAQTVRGQALSVMIRLSPVQRLNRSWRNGKPSK